MQKASVTEAHLCHRCPRLLAYKLTGQSRAWSVGLKGTGNFPGTLFHEKIARPFHAKLAARGLTRLKRELAAILAIPGKDLDERIHGLIKKEILDPLLSRRAWKMRADQVMALADGVKVWSVHLAGFLGKRQFINKEKIASALSGMVCEPEKKIRGVFHLGDGEPFELTGVFDAVLVDKAANEAVVVEFKGLKPAHEDEDFIQAALYAHLIKKATGVTPGCLVLYLEEEKPEAFYPVEVVENAEENLIHLLETAAAIKKIAKKRTEAILPPPPNEALCAVCPFDAACDADWGRRAMAGPRKEDAGEAEKIMDLLVSTLHVLKLPVEPLGCIFGPRLIRLKVAPNIEKGTTVRKVMNRAEDLQIALSLKTPPLIRAQAGHLSLDVPRKTTTPLTLMELWEKGQTSRPESHAAFPIGMAVNGAVTWADLTSPTMTSILVAGTA
ncbi:MAG: Dna2/Cas4 domain-containing protein, partial [Desulfobacterales bacterium]|nr:Dna2/Cas4 domain-containing protein [Desulfobacterales bacterium]